MPQWANGSKKSGTGVVVLPRQGPGKLALCIVMKGKGLCSGLPVRAYRAKVTFLKFPYGSYPRLAIAAARTRKLGGLRQKKEDRRDRTVAFAYWFCFAGKVPLSAVFPFNRRNVTSLVWALRNGMFFSQSEYAPFAVARRS
jgi:hypothetical protein